MRWPERGRAAFVRRNMRDQVRGRQGIRRRAPGGGRPRTRATKNRGGRTFPFGALPELKGFARAPARTPPGHRATLRVFSFHRVFRRRIKDFYAAWHAAGSRGRLTDESALHNAFYRALVDHRRTAQGSLVRTVAGAQLASPIVESSLSRNLADILRDLRSALPKPVRSADHEHALGTCFNDYTGLLLANVPSDFATQELRNAHPAIEELSRRLLEALNRALAGEPTKARAAFDLALNAVDPYLHQLGSQEISRQELGVLYRIRPDESTAAFDRSELFHIPYQLRHKVAPRRFSVLGLPMLYLGNTLYVCWEELDRPDFGQVWAAAFRLRAEKTVRVLNLAYRPGVVANLLEDAGYPAGDTPMVRLALAHAITWPLVAACTFPALHRKAPFVVEYVLPQFLLAWLSESDAFVGLRYFSSRVVRPPAAALAALNFVFPARQVTRDGFSPHLVSLFELTEPVHWPYLLALGGAVAPAYHGRTNAILSAGAGSAVPYAVTNFAQVESLLEQMTFASIR